LTANIQRTIWSVVAESAAALRRRTTTPLWLRAADYFGTVKAPTLLTARLALSISRSALV